MARRIIVTGGRTYGVQDHERSKSKIQIERERSHVRAVLSDVHRKRGITALIHGDASGADAVAKEWARERGVPEEPYPAQWQTEGRQAGFKRNQRMLDTAKPDGVIAFPGGSGTADMVAKAQAAGVPVMDRREVG